MRKFLIVSFKLQSTVMHVISVIHVDMHCLFFMIMHNYHCSRRYLPTLSIPAGYNLCICRRKSDIRYLKQFRSRIPEFRMSTKQYKYEQLTVQSDDELEQLDKNKHIIQDELFSPLEEMQSKEISIWKMVLNMLNYMEGVGFLAIPYAIREGGITAVIALCLLPFILGYTANLLSQCVDERDEAGSIVKRRLTYQEIAKDSWAPCAVVVWITNNINLLMALISYIVLCGSLMSQQFPQVHISAPQWASIGTLLVLPTVFFKQFSNIAWLSLLSLLALLAVIGLMLVYEIPMFKLSDLKSLFFWDTRGVFVSTSILTACYSIHVVCVPVAVDVRDQSKFKLALILSYFLGALLKVIFAFLGFLAFNVNTKEVILNNVPPGITAEIISTFFTLNALLTYAIPFLVIIRSIEQLSFYEKMCNKLHPIICDGFLRLILSMLVLFLSIEMRSHFALVAAFTGTTCTLDSLLFPPLFHLLLRYKNITKIQILIHCLLIVVSFAGFWSVLVASIISLMFY